nr:hypothetical protein [Treponema sp.]
MCDINNKKNIPEVTDFLDEFIHFCEEELPGNFINYDEDDNWINVQAVPFLSCDFHYEYNNGKLRLDIEFKDKQLTKEIIKLLKDNENINSKESDKKNKRNKFFILENNIINKDNLFNKLKDWIKIISNIVYSYFPKKNKILIALIAPPNKGKSSSIKQFYLNLIQKYRIQKKDIIFLNDYTETNNLGLLSQLYDDICRIVILNKKIGITSEGDYSNSLEKNIKSFINENCDIIVCACHEPDKCNNFRNLLDKYKNTFNVIELHKSYLSDSSDKSTTSIINYEFSKQILSIVEYYLNR